MRFELALAAGLVLTGVAIASLGGSYDTLQTADGRSIRLFLPNKGYLLVDPTSQPLSTGMRVFAHGFPRSLNLLMETPAPAST